MDPGKTHDKMFNRRSEWRFTEKSLLIILYITLFIVKSNCQTIIKDESSQIESSTKTELNLDNSVSSNHCHSCQSSSSKNEVNDSNIEDKRAEDEPQSGGFLTDFIDSVSTFSEKYVFTNDTEDDLKHILEKTVDKVLSKDKFEIMEGVEIKSIDNASIDDIKKKNEEESRALFSTYTYEYRLLQKIKNFVDTHIVSINIPKAAKMVGFRSFGLKKFFLPLLIGAQVFKSILLAMFLPSILGSFGKILGKGISQLSASSSQASYPPANVDDQNGYSNDNKDFMGYETNPAGSYMYPQDGMYGNMEDQNDVNDMSNVDMSRFGAGGQKVSYLPSKNSYYKNQMTSNNYKNIVPPSVDELRKVATVKTMTQEKTVVRDYECIFQKIPASSMILSNYDPFYSPLLSRLDGIFSRLGLAPSENIADDSNVQIGGQTLSDVKLEACREQLICLMYASPAKYAPYSNLVSAQLSRELNELRRPVSDNPEILRFFRYMRAARRGQEGTDCMRAHPACAANTAPQHTMIAAYHDINKLVTARKLKT